MATPGFQTSKMQFLAINPTANLCECRKLGKLRDGITKTGQIRQSLGSGGWLLAQVAITLVPTGLLIYTCS